MKAPRKDRRNSSLIERSLTVRIRPVEPQYPQEIRPTLSATRDGFYFATSSGHYFSGMVVSVAHNLQSPGPANREIQGTVVRVDKLKEGRWGVDVRFASDVKAKAAA